MTTPIYPSITDELLAELELLAIDAFEGQTTRMQQDARRELSEAVPGLVARIRELEAREVELPEAFSPNSCGEWAYWDDLVKRAIEKAGVRIKQ